LRKAIPALLYGNAIIQKPATISPGPLLMMRDIASDFFPKGLFDVVVGGGAIGQSLCEHQDINAVSFTGSVDVGRKVAIAAVSHFAEVSLELGGKNPVIVNDSLNLDAALDQITAAGFAVCGQRCTAISRVIVHKDLEVQIVEGLAKRTNAIKPSNGTEDGAQMGPLSSNTQLNDVSGFVERAICEGAKIAAGGTKINSDTGGYFYSPTILSGVTRNMEIARDEVFGPVMVVMTYSDIEEALSIANDVSFGLSSCLYSDQLHVVEKFIAESESGMLHINGGSFPQNHLPFVGVKDSALGVGGSNGASTIQFYTTEHTVYKSSLT
jgi:aldehyde dehydrogenase (NAD+)